MERGPLNSCRTAAPSSLQKQQDRAQDRARPWVPASVAPCAQAPIHACRITICSRRTRHNKGPLSCHSCGAGSQSGPLFPSLGIVREGSVGSAVHSHAGKGRAPGGPGQSSDGLDNRSGLTGSSRACTSWQTCQAFRNLGLWFREV